jgi:phage shock protein A
MRALDEALDKLGVTDDDVDQLLDAMRHELIDTKASIPDLERHLAGLEREHARELDKIEECVRRATQAEEIGDTETMEVAVRFAEEHRSRRQVLEQKIETTRAEIALKREEVVTMTAQLKEAMKRRDSLAAQARRARTIETTRGSGRDALDEFERVADRTGRGADVSDAAEELDRELEGDAAPSEEWKSVERHYDKSEREASAERLLRELKRRMGVDSDED